MTQTLKSLKTPLRYPGGKSRAVSKLFQYLPDLSQVKEYREPFIGGGSVAIEIGKRYPKMNIWVNDLYEPLYNFWCELRDNGREMRDQLVQLKYRYCEPASARILFQQAKGKVNDDQTSNLSRAVAFYVVNKCSFSGLTESSSFSKQASESNFSMRGIDKLPDYSLMIKDWKITNVSYEGSLPTIETYSPTSTPHMILEITSMDGKGLCTSPSIMMPSLAIVIALLVLNLYLTIRLNWSKIGSKGGR